MIRSTLMPKSKHKTYHSKLQYILVVFPKNVTIPVYYLTQYSYQLRKKNVLDTFYKFDCLYQHSYSHFPTYKTSIQYHKMLPKFFLDTFPWNIGSSWCIPGLNLPYVWLRYESQIYLMDLRIYLVKYI